MKRAIEWRPRVTMSAGSRTSSWRRRNGAQAAISSGSGSRFSGRAALDDVRDEDVLAPPADRAEQADEEVAGPAHERAALAILVHPGSLPHEDHLRAGMPLAGDGAWSGPRGAGSAVHARTSAAIASSAARRSASVTPAGPPRRAATPPRTHPRATRTSAISTAFVAAPLRMLSETHPEGEAAAVRDRRVGPDAADVDLVAARRLGGERVDVGGRVVADDDAGDGREQLAGPGRA